MKQSRKDFIIEAHDNACNDWRNRIEKEFPKLFKKDDLVVGKWYRSSIDCIFNYNGVKDCNNKPCGYGISRLGSWYESNKDGWGGSYTLVTDKEVDQALIKEAKKKDYKNVKINNLESIGNMLSFHHSISSSDCYYYNATENALWFMGKLIFWNGKWAEIFKETITKEQAEKELGKTILN
jgi:hypothetical protein